MLSTAVVASEIGISFSTTNGYGSKYRGGSTYNDDKTHIDYEVYGEGNGNGNVHLQQGKNKYKIFELDNHIPRNLPIDDKIRELINKTPKISRAIDKAIKFVINLGG